MGYSGSWRAARHSSTFVSSHCCYPLWPLLRWWRACLSCIRPLCWTSALTRSLPRLPTSFGEQPRLQQGVGITILEGITLMFAPCPVCPLLLDLGASPGPLQRDPCSPLAYRATSSLLDFPILLSHLLSVFLEFTLMSSLLAAFLAFQHYSQVLHTHAHAYAHTRLLSFQGDSGWEGYSV